MPQKLSVFLTLLLLGGCVTDAQPQMQYMNETQYQPTQYQPPVYNNAAANALGEYSRTLQTQQMINAMQRPVTTNCTALGNNVNCVSQ
jgi:hypothetical protein